MSKTHKLLLGAAVVWVAVATQVGLVLLSDSIGELSTVLASVGIVVFTPLALIAFAWLWARPEPPSPKRWVTVLSLPWVLAAVGILVGRAMHEEDEWPRYSRPAPTPVQYYWARTPTGKAAMSPDFYGDSVFLERLRIRFRAKDPSNGYYTDKIALSGIIRNGSNSSVTVVGFWGEYLSQGGEAVGDFSCTVYGNFECGFTRIELRPGYVADFAYEVSPGPSLARRDTLSFYVRFRVHDRF